MSGDRGRNDDGLIIAVFRQYAVSDVWPAYFLFCRTSNQTARLMMRPLMISW
jgi:hypothetical protein